VKFLMNDQTYEIFTHVLYHLNAHMIMATSARLVDIGDHENLALIARGLGAEELTELAEPRGAGELIALGDTVVVNPVRQETDSGIRSCEICGKPVTRPRAKVCSPECLKEKARRYARQYQAQKAESRATGGRATADPFEESAEAVSEGSEVGG